MNPYEQEMVILGILRDCPKIRKENGEISYGLNSYELSNIAGENRINRIDQITAKQNLLGMGYITISSDWIEITPAGRKELLEYEKEQHRDQRTKGAPVSNSNTCVDTCPDNTIVGEIIKRFSVDCIEMLIKKLFHFIIIFATLKYIKEFSGYFI